MFADLHPVIVHFPIALFTVIPLFLTLGLVFAGQRRNFFITAFLLLILGTLGAFFAVWSGEAASELIAKEALSTDGLQTLNRHHDQAELARTLYLVLTVVLGLFLWTEKRAPERLQKIVPIILLAASLSFLPLLFEAAHHGGKLVHQHHIHSRLFNAQ